MCDDVTQDDLDDAIIEDTCHCQCCGASFVLGGNDDVLVEVPQPTIEAPGRVTTLSLCIECAEATYKAYIAAAADAGVCPHGEALNKACESCQAPINLCKDIVAFWGSHEAWGDFASLTRASGAFAPIADRARAILEGRQ